jgi:hypothetical protein
MDVMSAVRVEQERRRRETGSRQRKLRPWRGRSDVGVVMDESRS